MTQPSVNMTFDTSLIDTHNLNASFSTIESDASEADAPTTIKASTQLDVTPTPPPKPSTPVQHLPTQDAYDSWAAVYDTDGNMLQAIDDVELSTFLPEFLASVESSVAEETIQLLDLGCGTGRNTSKLLSYPYVSNPERLIEVTALDFSAGMLDVAREKLAPLRKDNVKLRISQADCFPTLGNEKASPVPAVGGLSAVDGVVSTLVLEHVPLGDYFATVASLVRKGGFALVTNMHSEMGKMSQAGFVNAEGVKVRGTSFAHTPSETVEAATKAGFEVVSLKERIMRREDVESGRVGERGLKWVGIHVWYGVLLRRL
ncbi:S-adenosyl-L-methionine-dependent methyltransferase [Karstenula rhodostoma CBS 690.94]|uniref:S-adenosyl-L-methionine-dependent methyltransferase n=1 Tax=Karstenula rhodostoma CBS 690.94 TaxID=1392251 RepID=A0A9P4P7B5_9PLEO|nr:S-adenosyl-L-methionine-dependent methyltransferase [Karstenula rhodostoma CBS 690.94]